MPDTLIAPAPSPSPSPAPSPAPSPSPSPGSKPATSSETSTDTAEIESVFDKMEAHYKPETKVEPAAKAVPPAAKSKDEPTVKTLDKKAETIETGPKALREQLTKVNKERDEAIGEKSRLEAKIKEFEVKGKDTTALTDQLSAVNKEKEELMAEIRMLKKETDPKFKEKWDTPFHQAAEYAREVIEGIEVNTDEGIRMATWADFIKLYNMPIGKALKPTRELFGEDATLVIAKLEHLHGLDKERENALKEEKSRWKENETRDLAEKATFKENWDKASNKKRQELITAHPEWYDEDPNDPEGNELLKQGREYLEYVPKTEAEAVGTYQRNQLNAIAMPRMAARVDKLKAENEELKVTIEEMKNSGPGRTKRSTTDKAPEGMSMEDELRQAVR